MPVQVNGKLRARLTVPAETGEDELRERALAARRKLHRGQDRQKSGGGQGAAGERGGSVIQRNLRPSTLDLGPSTVDFSQRLQPTPKVKSLRTTFALASLLILVTLTGSSCGYTLAGRGSFLPDYIKTIGIPTFENRTTLFNLETQLTQKVRSEFIGRGQYQIVPEATNVDAVLTGEVSG